MQRLYEGQATLPCDWNIRECSFIEQEDHYNTSLVKREDYASVDLGDGEGGRRYGN